MPVPNPLPLVLAGPILRRVESTSVSVWVALSKEAAVHLTVYKGALSDSNPTGTLFFASTTNAVYGGDAPTIAIGDNLHVTVVTAELPANEELEVEQLYSYLLTFTTTSGGVEDLKSLGLLKANNDPHRVQGPLGYLDGALPSFATPPADVDQLVILQGSCRKPHGPGHEAFAAADILIEQHRLDPFERPHQLFLTGDQIYADDVAEFMLYAIDETANALFGNRHEKLPCGSSAAPPFNPNWYDAVLVNFPADRRQKLIYDFEELEGQKKRRRRFDQAYMTSTVAHSHLLSFREFCAMYVLAWSPAAWPTQVAPVPGTQPSSIEMFLYPETDVEREQEHIVRNLANLRAIGPFYTQLGRVRRLLANIPVYMMFDDHEITDDWYLSYRWRHRVLGRPLGRAIIRNGLAAYTIFQAWGNNPRAFAKAASGPDPVGRQLLDLIPSVFPLANDDAPAATFDNLVGLGALHDPDNPAPAMRWDYTVTSPVHHVIVLDTRTRRRFRGPLSSPGLMTAAAMTEQIQPAPQSVGVTIVVSPAPILGVALVETGQRLAAAWENVRSLDTTGESGQLEYDAEPWSFDETTFELLLTRLLPLLPNVVVLSGDVHYSFSGYLTYWLKNTTTGAYDRKGRLVQLTSSALKNAPEEIDSWLVSPRQAAFSQIETVVEEADATRSWRWRLALDMRDDDDTAVDPRPAVLRPQPLPPDDSAKLTYKRVFDRVVWALRKGTRRNIYWSTSLGRISFPVDANGNLWVRHEITAPELDGAKVPTGNVLAAVAHAVPFDDPTEVAPQP